MPTAVADRTVAPVAVAVPATSVGRAGGRVLARPSTSLAPRILILGGGFAGVTAALGLARRCAGLLPVHITLVSNQNFFLFTPMLAEAATGAVETRHILYPIRPLCGRWGIEFGEMAVEAIDLEEHRGRRLLQPPAAAAVHGGEPNPGLRQREPGPGGARAPAPGREPVELSALPALADPGARVPGRAGATDRLRAALRRQQRLRLVRQPRSGCRRVPGRATTGCDRRDPPGRSRGEPRGRPDDPDRRPRLARGRGGLGSVRADGRPVRAGADADRVGHRHSGARRAAGRGADGRGHCQAPRRAGPHPCRPA